MTRCDRPNTNGTSFSRCRYYGKDEHPIEKMGLMGQGIESARKGVGLRCVEHGGGGRWLGAREGIGGVIA